MPIKVKLNRGPAKGKYYILQNEHADRVEWVKPTPVHYYDPGFYPGEAVVVKGHYQRSNVKLKNGAWVFEWMGWRDNDK